MDLKCVGVKIEKKDQALLLLSSLPESYNHLVTSILYGKETLKMEEVTSTLIANESMEMPNSIEELSELFANERGRSKSRNGGKGGRSRSKFGHENDACFFCKQNGHTKRIVLSTSNG